MRDVYRCTPEELDRQDAHVVELHQEFIAIERREERLAARRAEQQAKLKH